MGCEDWVIGGLEDCTGISLEAEDRATQWLRGAGRRLRVDGDCVISGLIVRGWSVAPLLGHPLRRQPAAGGYP